MKIDNLWEFCWVHYFNTWPIPLTSKPSIFVKLVPIRCMDTEQHTFVFVDSHHVPFAFFISLILFFFCVCLSLTFCRSFTSLMSVFLLCFTSTPPDVFYFIHIWFDGHSFCSLWTDKTDNNFPFALGLMILWSYAHLLICAYSALHHIYSNICNVRRRCSRRSCII